MDLNLLELLTWLYAIDVMTEDPHVQRDRENLEMELETLDQMQADAEKLRAFAAENPDDPIAKVGLLLAEYAQVRPFHTWDWDRLREVAEISVPLAELIRECDPDADISMELGGLLGNDALMVIVSSEGGDIGSNSDMMPEWRKIAQGIDGFGIAPSLEDRVCISIEFKGVRKAEK